MPFSIRLRLAAHPRPCRASMCSSALPIPAMGYLSISRPEFLNHFLQRRTKAEIPALDYLRLQKLLKTTKGSLIYRRSLNAVRVFWSICPPGHRVIEVAFRFSQRQEYFD